VGESLGRPKTTTRSEPENIFDLFFIFFALAVYFGTIFLPGSWVSFAIVYTTRIRRNQRAQGNDSDSSLHVQIVPSKSLGLRCRERRTTSAAAIALNPSPSVSSKSFCYSVLASNAGHFPSPSVRFGLPLHGAVDTGGGRAYKQNERLFLSKGQSRYPGLSLLKQW
jgi:hypothetical protein